MATVAERKMDWTVEDLAERFGPMPVHRFRFDPAPGTATEDDVVRIHDRENRLYELVEGVLLEKTMGWYESYLAVRISTLLNVFVLPRKLGIVAGADGMYRLNPDLVRIPDVSFIRRDRFTTRRLPRNPLCRVVPNLAVEVLSESNTRKEMGEKLLDYFGCGVELVWYVEPAAKTIRVYRSPRRSKLIRETQSIDAPDLLPGFSFALSDLFADPLADPVA